jgi:hypothetical protein
MNNNNETCVIWFSEVLKLMSYDYPGNLGLKRILKVIKNNNTERVKINLMKHIIRDIEELELSDIISYDNYRGSWMEYCLNVPPDKTITLFINYLYDTTFNFIIANKDIFNTLKNTDKLFYRDLKWNLYGLIKTTNDINYKNYYKELIGIPYFLNVPIEHYNNRQNVYFSDVICGHPKASHGWCYEAMEELRELGCF